MSVQSFQNLALEVLDKDFALDALPHEQKFDVDWWRDIAAKLIEEGLTVVEENETLERRFAEVREEVDRCLLELRGMRCEMEHVQGKHRRTEGSR